MTSLQRAERVLRNDAAYDISKHEQGRFSNLKLFKATTNLNYCNTVKNTSSTTLL